MAKKRGEIPLAAIPARRQKKGNGHPLEFRKRAVAAMREKPVAELAAELGVTAAALYAWRKALDPFAELRSELEAADLARAERLERCALVVQREGPEGIRVADAIRALARGGYAIRVDIRDRKPPSALRRAKG